MALYTALARNGVVAPADCKTLSADAFAEIVRTVRGEARRDLKGRSGRKATERMLGRFERVWRRETGTKRK